MLDESSQKKLQQLLYTLVNVFAQSDFCVMVYERALENAAAILESAIEEIRTVKSTIISMSEFLLIVLEEDIEAIQANITYFDALRKDYSVFKLKKLDLARMINSTTVFDITLLLSSIVSKTSIQGKLCKQTLTKF